MLQLASKLIVAGSSPLARGLLDMHGVLKAGDRIIPARAGFTWRRKEHIGNMEDHPRSRGVYREGYSAGVLVHFQEAIL